MNNERTCLFLLIAWGLQFGLIFFIGWLLWLVLGAFGIDVHYMASVGALVVIWLISVLIGKKAKN